METKEESAFMDKWAEYVGEQLEVGKGRRDVIQDLVKQGMNESGATQIVDKVVDILKQTEAKEEISGEVIIPALLGGLIAAILGGGLWGAIIIWTGYENGYMAWVIGLLSGFGVLAMARGKRGLPLQTIASVFSLTGIVLGKYIAFSDRVNEIVGNEGIDSLSIVSNEAIQLFFGNLPSSLISGFSALWFIPAVLTAGALLKPSNSLAIFHR